MVRILALGNRYYVYPSNFTVVLYCDSVFYFTIGRFKDSLIDEKSRETDPSLIDYLAASGFDLLTHSHAPPDKSANGALDEGQHL